MILFNPSPLVPKPLRRTYAVLRGVMVASFFVIVVLSLKAFLFPPQDFLYSFESQTAKNTLSDPTLISGDSFRQGNLRKGEALLTYAGAYGGFTSLSVRITLETDSAAPETIPFSVRKSFRSFFFPEGDPVEAAPKDHAFSSDGDLYYWDDVRLSPFLSEIRGPSRFDPRSITEATAELFRVFPPGDDPVGFRVGSLLSNTEEIFAVTSTEEIRAIGSPDIFTALGFDWKNVIPANEEELGFYRRGKVMLFDAEQPDGTLFRDRDTGGTYLVDGGRKRLIRDSGYASLLSGKTTPIEVSGKALDTEATCVLQRDLISFFGATYSCTVPLAALEALPGASYALSLEAPDDLHIASVETTFQTDLTRDNLSVVIRKLRDRLSSRYTK